jgi:hypothetical protein
MRHGVVTCHDAGVGNPANASLTLGLVQCVYNLMAVLEVKFHRPEMSQLDRLMSQLDPTHWLGQPNLLGRARRRKP